MTLLAILVFTITALLIGWIIPARWRIWVTLAASLLAVYWLQPALPIRNLDFWLPTISVLLTLSVWVITQKTTELQVAERKLIWAGGLLILAAILMISLTRYLGPLCCLTPTRPPDILRVGFFLVIGGAIALLPVLFPGKKRTFSSLAIFLIIGLFIMLKSPAILGAASSSIRSLTGQDVELASPQDIVWFGFSFLAFRLLHVLFDFRSGKLPPYRLDEFVTYVLFFPALPAGPIDRSQRFSGDLHQINQNTNQNTLQGSRRIILGLFKKFFIADSLALIALNSQNATQVDSPLWMWLLVYAYALRIYFDFSGYTDLAIGIAKLIGINLPENFDKPYLKQNLTAFWNSWHMTLAQWFRAYYFNPLARLLRTRAQKLPAWAVIMICQFTTMLLIGIWHGITWNYAIWGVWHGLGLFIHNRWTDFVRRRSHGAEHRPGLQQAGKFVGWFITFNYVALGWIWFALPSVNLSVEVFQKLV